METTKLRVSEIFYSLQGEGARSGNPSIFIRLSGCSAKYACLASGVMCDTEFESGKEMTLAEILTELQKYPCGAIIWTGGEPLDQLNSEILSFFTGYFHCLETSGLKRPCEGFDYICVSPKVAEHVIKKNFSDIKIDELRYVRDLTQSVPEPLVEATRYYLSPHASGQTLEREVVDHVISLCKENPKWSLSIQLHKLLYIR